MDVAAAKSDATARPHIARVWVLAVIGTSFFSSRESTWHRGGAGE